MSVSSELQRLKATTEAKQAEVAARNEKVVHPAGWEPGVRWSGNEGTVITRPTTETPDGAVDWSHVLGIWGLDSSVFEVVEPVEFRAWDTNVGGGEVVTMYYYKARVIAKSKLANGLDIDDLLNGISDYPPQPKSNGLSSSNASLVVCLADWQTGKGSENREGSGVEYTIGLILEVKMALRQRVAELRGMGRKIGIIYVIGMGDLVERCSGNYLGQEFTTELNERQQSRVARRLLKELIVEWSDLSEKMIVAAVGGNHGENRQNGKKFTDDGDNEDVALFETVAEALAMNPAAFGHVSFVIPEDKLFLTLNISGANVTFSHGHKAKSGATPAKKQQNWWEKMAFNGSELADTDILVTGHYHHFIQTEVSKGKWFFQCPCMDPGSKWFEDIGGATSSPGTLTFLVEDGRPSDVQVLPR